MFRTAGRVSTALIHICLGPWVGLAGLLVLTVGLALTTGFAITVVGGAFFLASTSWVVGRFARVERARARSLLGAEIADPAPDRRTHRFGFIGRQLTSGQAWRAMAYTLVNPIVSTALFAVTVVLWCWGLVGAALPFYIKALPVDTARLLVADVDTGPEIAVATAAGIAALLAAPLVTLAARQVHLAMVRGLLGRDRVAELEATVEAVSGHRDAAVEAAAAERRRIERDLHDGAQQRLVSLGMTLGLAQQRLDNDPAAARALLDEAHVEAKAAISELRATARGIHPAILDDRGLDAALSALVGRSPIPVTIAAVPPGRLAANVESAAYYVVAEALTNVAKHAEATEAEVRVSLDGETVVVDVSDDGRGGATLLPDGGLAGLRARVSALGGTLNVTSPEGGPTVLSAELPCEP